jgi:hypothetical protein
MQLICILIEAVSRRVLLLATEYRNIANAHLSYHPPGESTFVLSPLSEVNIMLIADKIQNRKDFELYHVENGSSKRKGSEMAGQQAAIRTSSSACAPLAVDGISVNAIDGSSVRTHERASRLAEYFSEW